MKENKFYFIKDEYFEKYYCEDNKPNKESDEDGEHKRPCYKFVAKTHRQAYGMKATFL